MSDPKGNNEDGWGGSVGIPFVLPIDSRINLFLLPTARPRITLSWAELEVGAGNAAFRTVSPASGAGEAADSFMSFLPIMV